MDGLHRYQPSYWHSSIRDGDPFAAGNALEQPGEVSLGLMDIHFI